MDTRNPLPSSASALNSYVQAGVRSNGPRYTSYPTADRFTDRFGEADYQLALEQRASLSSQFQSPLSLYVHIPFCASVCYYCACNKVVTRHHEQAGEYLDAIEQEIRLHLNVIGPRQRVSQLHLGGGTPTFLSDAELQRLMGALRSAFDLTADAELSIEVDPRTVSHARLAHLDQLGFNRISLGVQDFDENVQRAVHRVQPFEDVAALMQSARNIGFTSINMDLIHGLPEQTLESFAATLDRVAQLRPDRIALYAYAHMPERFKPQRRIDAASLPGPATRAALLALAIDRLLAEGYRYIGMDHFALPDDPLAIAQQQGQLHRNFQGYSTRPDCDLIALGVSSIGKVGNTYSQNAKTLEAYYHRIWHGRFATERGVALDSEDVLRREVIMALMCQGRLDFDAIAASHGVHVREHFAYELDQLEPLAELGLVSVERDAIQVTADGWHFVRAVAMVFDSHLNPPYSPHLYTKPVYMR